MSSLFTELRRRNVFRVGAAYVVTAWLVAQVAELGLEAFEAPPWVLKVLLLALGIGFPIALVFAWAYELTPDGLKREREVDRSQSVTADTGRKLDRVTIAAMGLVIAFLLADRFLFSGEEQAPAGEQARTEPTEQARSAPETAETRGASPERAASVPEKSVAVLPFADLSQSQDYGWFVDGLTEEVLNALAQTPDLLVSSRTSSFRYKETDLAIGQIAEALGVAHVLEGSVRRGEDRIRVTAQLIRASDGFHVWSQTYDREPDDIIDIQEDLARSIASALQTGMDPEALADMSQAGTRSIQAYLEFIQGRSALSPGSRDPVAARREAYEHYERAWQIDPGFARAHFAAADYWHDELSSINILSSVSGMSAQEMLGEFNRRIDAAIAAAKSDVERKLYRARKAIVELRLRDALDLLEEYLAERPGDGEARADAVEVATWARDLDTARRWLEETWRFAMTSDMEAGRFLTHIFRLPDVERYSDRIAALVDKWRDRGGILYQGHRALLWAGRTELARSVADRLLALVSDFPSARDLAIARNACAAGDRGTVEAILAELDPEEDRLRGNRWHLLLLLGRKDEATEALRPMVETGVPFRIAGQLGYPQFDPRPFEPLMKVLEREGIQPASPAEVPFACPPAEANGSAPDTAAIRPQDAAPASDADSRHRVPAAAGRAAS